MKEGGSLSQLAACAQLERGILRTVRYKECTISETAEEYAGTYMHTELSQWQSDSCAALPCLHGSARR